ncbi:JmjC domain-containing protein 7 [Balamuthia mandrillaris]
MEDALSRSNSRCLQNAFSKLSEEASELYLPSEIPRVPVPASPLEFYREYVAPNKPVIFTNSVDHWPALTRWSNEYLAEVLADCEVTVDVTPTGYGDAIVGDRFVTPDIRKMPFTHFLQALSDHSSFNGIPYIQHQNGNFSKDFSKLWRDIEEDIEWVTEALGMPPDVVNFWMGDDRSVSSLHKDHYENLYVVIAGEKLFTLYPPTDMYFLPEKKNLRVASYRERTTTASTTNNSSPHHSSFDIIDSDPPTFVPWIAVDPFPVNDEEREKQERLYPRFKKATPFHVRLRPGEMLYLPSLWYHHVRQRADEHGRVIAVNFWYDMQYDVKYNYFKFMEALINDDEAEEKEEAEHSI